MADSNHISVQRSSWNGGRDFWIVPTHDHRDDAPDLEPTAGVRGSLPFPDVVVDQGIEDAGRTIRWSGTRTAVLRAAVYYKDRFYGWLAEDFTGWPWVMVQSGDLLFVPTQDQTDRLLLGPEG
jgi:hypothetical protein